MTAREDEIRRLVAELDAHIVEAEARLAALKALLADGEGPGVEERKGSVRTRGRPSFSLFHSRTRAGHPTPSQVSDLLFFFPPFGPG